MPMPHTTPPMIWLLAVFVLRMRPAATALTTRVTRITPSRSSTFTSAKMAEWTLWACGPSSAKVVDSSLSMRSAPPCRMASAIDTAREASRLLTSLPSASATTSGAAFASGEFGICLASRSNSLRTAAAVVAIPFDTEAAIHDPIGAGADVGGRAGHFRMSVGGEHDAYRDGRVQCFPDAGGHAPAYQVGAVAHRAQ